jgi:hypothetical protein
VRPSSFRSNPPFRHACSFGAGSGLLESCYQGCLAHEVSGIGVGLLINFRVTHRRDGIKRMVDGKNWEK